MGCSTVNFSRFCYSEIPPPAIVMYLTWTYITKALQASSVVWYIMVEVTNWPTNRPTDWLTN